uniref:Uncharacterized protein n=1 Tax=Oryza nivara TaxID=4536 RepID=A0A0E0HRN6_ORYNI
MKAHRHVEAVDDGRPNVYLANVVPVTAWAIAFSAVASVAVAVASAVEAAAHAPPPFWIRENLAARIPTSRSAQRYKSPSLPTEARAVPANLLAATRRRSEEDDGGAALERRRGRTVAAARILEWSGARVLVLRRVLARPPHQRRRRGLELDPKSSEWKEFRLGNQGRPPLHGAFSSLHLSSVGPALDF